MSSSECDVCCGCVALRSAVRMCGIFKVLLAFLSFVGPPIVMVSTMMPNDGDGGDQSTEKPCLVISFCSNFITIEFFNIFFSILLCCYAGKKPAINLYILCGLMGALNLFYFVGVVFISVYSKGFMVVMSVGFFLPSTLLTLYTTAVVWGLVKYERTAKDEPVHPPEMAVVPAPVQSSGYDYNYGAPVYYVQPYQVQSYEAQQYQNQPYQVQYQAQQLYPAEQPYQVQQPYQGQQPYQVQPYQVQQPYAIKPDRSKVYGIKAAREGQ